MNHSKPLDEKFRAALERLASAIRRSGRNNELLAIGIVTTDAVDRLGARLLFVGDLPEDAPTFQRLSPVEWTHSHEGEFTELNEHLRSLCRDGGESDEAYKDRVSSIIDACARSMNDVGLRDSFPSLVYLTFAGVDPNSTLEAAEAVFVARMNSEEVAQQWATEFG